MSKEQSPCSLLHHYTAIEADGKRGVAETFDTAAHNLALDLLSVYQLH